MLQLSEGIEYDTANLQCPKSGRRHLWEMATLIKISVEQLGRISR